MARRSELWLLDEPHAGLDQGGRDAVDRLIRSAAEAGATVVVASHELDRAGGIADRTVTIAGGTVVGGPKTLAAHDVLASTKADMHPERRQNDQEPEQDVLHVP